MDYINQHKDDLLSSTNDLINAKTVEESKDFRTMSLESLIAHIKLNHHTFIREQVSLIQHLAEMVLHDHRDNYEFLQELYDITCRLLDNMMPHLLKEERIIFPYIEYMESMALKGKNPKKPQFGNVKGSVLRMHNEHDQACSMLARLREISNDFTAPDEASDKWVQLYAKLKELDDDTQMHLHLEDDILYKRALALEQEFYKQ